MRVGSVLVSALGAVVLASAAMAQSMPDPWGQGWSGQPQGQWPAQPQMQWGMPAGQLDPVIVQALAMLRGFNQQQCSMGNQMGCANLQQVAMMEQQFALFQGYCNQGNQQACQFLMNARAQLAPMVGGMQQPPQQTWTPQAPWGAPQGVPQMPPQMPMPGTPQMQMPGMPQMPLPGTPQAMPPMMQPPAGGLTPPPLPQAN